MNGNNRLQVIFLSSCTDVVKNNLKFYVSNSRGDKEAKVTYCSNKLCGLSWTLKQHYISIFLYPWVHFWTNDLHASFTGFALYKTHWNINQQSLRLLSWKIDQVTSKSFHSCKCARWALCEMNYDRHVLTIGSLCKSIVMLQSCGLKSCEVFGSFQSMPSLNTVPQQHLHSPYLIPWHASHFGLSGEVPLIYRVQKISVRIPQEMPEKKPWNESKSHRNYLTGVSCIREPFLCLLFRYVCVCASVRGWRFKSARWRDLCFMLFQVRALNANNK